MLYTQHKERIKPDVLTCIANLSNDEVFTSPSLAAKILDLLPQEVWSDPNLKLLDPACKTGIFLRLCAQRFFVGLQQAIPNEDERLQHIFKNMLYGISITKLTGLLSRRTLYCSVYANAETSICKLTTPEGNILYQRVQHTFNNGHCIYCKAPESLERGEHLENYAYNFIHPNNNGWSNMKFDVIMGNPPYQIDDDGHGASARPIYHKFIEQAIKLNPKYISMIVPARWYAGGKGLDDFRETMLSDTRIQTLVDIPNAEECFPGVEIKGGVCYFLWNAHHKGSCEVISIKDGIQVSKEQRNLNEFDVFVRHNQAISILEKVQTKKYPTYDTKVFSRKPFGFSTNFKDYQTQPFDGSITLYGNKFIGYIHPHQIQEKFKGGGKQV